MTGTPTAESLPERQRNATVAVYGDLDQAEEAVRTLEHGGFEMAQLSIVARGMNEERHVIGFDTPAVRAGVGPVAVGGYLTYLLITAVVGAGFGALTATLSTLGIPADAVIRYETALRADKQILIAHGTTADVERAREILAQTAAESVEVHHGAGVPVA